MQEKRAAMELSIGTIVVVVIAVTMLILGLVLVRTIMCSAIGLTGEINDKVRSEIGKLFQTTGGEVVCIGSAGEPVTLIPGKLNIIYCAVNAEQARDYTFTASVERCTISGTNDDNTAECQNWVVGGAGGATTSYSIGTTDQLPKKILRIDIPKEAGEQNMEVRVSVFRDGLTLPMEQSLDFSIRRIGFFRSAMC